MNDSLLSELEELLVLEIPASVQATSVDEPMYCLRIWYCGKDTDGDWAPQLMLKKESARQAALAEKGKMAPHYIWCADELTSPSHIFNIPYSMPQISSACRRLYKSIENPQLDEKEGLQPIRQLIQRVSRRLNALEWKDITNATDDFVVISADGSHIFCADYDEMLACLSSEQLAQLRAHKFLGNRVWSDLD